MCCFDILKVAIKSLCLPPHFNDPGYTKAPCDHWTWCLKNNKAGTLANRTVSAESAMPLFTVGENKRVLALCDSILREYIVPWTSMNLTRHSGSRFCYLSPVDDYGGSKVHQNGMFRAVNPGWLNFNVQLKTILSTTWGTEVRKSRRTSGWQPYWRF